MKKFIMCLGAVSILTSMSVAMAFPDVSSTHWAKKEIDAMYNKGIISGYPDGTFKPSKDITKIESLILLSKIAGINEYPEEAKIYETTYKKDLAKYNTIYKKQVAYLLGTGVIEKADLPNLLGDDKINSPIMREEMAVLITKIMGKEEEVNKKSVFILPFADIASISSSVRPYVDFVYNEGIMNGITEVKNGVTQDNFSPKTYVTRAQVAIILDKIIDKVNIVPKVENTTQNTDTTNVTLSITKGEITLVDTLLKTIEIDEDIYEYDDNTKFYIDGETVDELDIFEGMEVVEAKVKVGKITSLNVTEEKQEIESVTGTVTGEIVSINISDDKVLTLYVGNKEKSYYLSSSTKYYIGSESATLFDFEVGEEVTITVDDGTVTKMIVGEEENTAAYKIGTITLINDDEENIKIELKNGNTEMIYLASTFRIVDSLKANTIKLSKLSRDDQIIAVGEYKGNKFFASVIVVYYE